MSQIVILLPATAIIVPKINLTIYVYFLKEKTLFQPSLPPPSPPDAASIMVSEYLLYNSIYVCMLLHFLCFFLFFNLCTPDKLM